ncbi:MAG: Gldg family protein [Spirochaetes bacterium]|nr:Gldg family protein [Spirochaetota bacterium]
MKIQDIIGACRAGSERLVARVRGILSGPVEKGEQAGNGRGVGVQFVLYIVIIILINLVGLTLNFRCDLTRNDSFSLSDRSRDIVANLKENLKIRVLFSKDLPAQHTSIYRYLKDLLEEYDYYGNEYFSYEIVDDKDLEKVAADYGIRPVQSQEFENDQVKVRRTYMALVIRQSDVIEKLEAITDPTGLEYNITSLMEKMSGKIDGLLRLEQPIQVILYMDTALKELPIQDIDSLEEKVKAAVEKCNSENYDKLRLQVLDPSADKTAGISAQMYGVPKLNWKAGQDRTGKFIAAGDAYFGIVMKNENKVEIIDISVAPTLMGKNVITGLDKLEDRINNGVGSLVSANPRIGYISGQGEVDLDEQQSPQGGAVLKRILSDVYDIKQVSLEKEDIPADLGLIIVNGPRKEFTESELYKIDQFLMRGKSAIFFLDSFTEVSMGRQTQFMQQPLVLPVNTGLDPLLKSYGITVSKNIVLDSSCARGMAGGAVRDFYHVPVIRKAGFNQQSVITKFLKGLGFIKVSSVDADGETVKRLKLSRADLVSSSDESWQMTGKINLNPFLMSPPENKADMKKYTVALLLSGKFESHFKNKEIPIPEKKEKDDTAPVAKETFKVSKLDATVSSGVTNIIVVGSSEITRSGFLMNAKRIISSSAPGEDSQDRVFSNGFFIHSMVDVLLGNPYIPEMASKSLEYNPLEKTGDRMKIALKVLNIALVPIFIVAAGLFILKRRSQRKKRIQDRFSREAGHE